MLTEIRGSGNEVTVSRGSGNPGFGSVPADVMIVGFAPRSPSTSRPFGSALLEVTSFIREELGGTIYCTNLSQTPQKYPQKLTKTEAESALLELQEEIALVKPQAILLLGADVSKVFLKTRMESFLEDRGTTFLFEEGFFAMPTFHPSALKTPKLTSQFSHDLERLKFALIGKVQLPDTLVDELPQNKKPSYAILDVETEGLYGPLLLLGLRVDGVSHVFTPPLFQEAFAYLVEIASAGCEIVGHNLSYDLSVLRTNFGHSVDSFKLFDTMVAHHILGYENLSLKTLSTQSSLSFPGCRASRDFITYNSLDLQGTELLYQQSQKLPAREVFSALMEWVKIASRSSSEGVFILRDRLIEVEKDLHVESLTALSNLKKLLGDINPNSPLQLGPALIRCGVPLEKTEKGNFSTAEQALSAVAETHPAAAAVLSYREKTKLHQMMKGYLESGTHYLHPKLKICGTATGRFSCEDPNMQQVPREGPLKSIFASRYGEQGRIILMDLSQAELRCAAIITKDSKIIEALAREDVHRAIASLVFKKPPEKIDSHERKWSKRVTFGILYGGSPVGLSAKFGLKEEEVKKIFKGFFAEFTGVKSWIDSIRNNPPREVNTLLGRKRSLEDFFPEDINAAVRRAINTPIQSLASDLLLIIGAHANLTFRKRNLAARVLFPVHDSILIDSPREEVEEILEVLSGEFKRIKRLLGSELFVDGQEIEISGDGAIGLTWAETESTSEYYHPEATFTFSTISGLSIERKTYP